jgi:hypothetical protein
MNRNARSHSLCELNTLAEEEVDVIMQTLQRGFGTLIVKYFSV